MPINHRMKIRYLHKPVASLSLSELSLSKSVFFYKANQGTVIGTIKGRVPGSTVTCTDPRVSVSGSNLIVGSTQANLETFSIALNELAPDGQTSHTSVVFITVVSAYSLKPLALSGRRFNSTDAAGATIGAFSGTTSGTTLSCSDGRVAFSGTNLIVGLSAAAAGGFPIVVRETAPDGTYHETRFNIAVYDLAKTFVTPGTTPYRSWGIIDPTTLAQQGSVVDYGYTSPAVGQWIGGSYNSETGLWCRGVAAWKGGTLANIQSGDLRGIRKVSYSLDNGPWVDVTQVTVDPATGRAGYWIWGTVFDQPVSLTSELRAIAWPKVGKPFVLQGRSAAGPGGQAPTYDLAAGPYLPVNGSATVFANQSYDGRTWQTGAVNGGDFGLMNTMPGCPSMILNQDTGDGLMPRVDMFLDADNGNDSNDGLTASTPVKTFDAIYTKAPPIFQARYGQMTDNLGHFWTDCGGLVVNLLAGTNHAISMSSYQTMLSAANQWITIQRAPGLNRGDVKITGSTVNGFNCEKIRLVEPDFVNCSFKPTTGAAHTDQYGDIQFVDPTWDGTPAGRVQYGFPIGSPGEPVALTMTSGGANYQSPTTSGTYTGTTGTGVNFIAVVTGKPLSVTVLDGGKGYTAATTVTGPAGTTAGSGAVFTPVITNGVITSVTLDATSATSLYVSGTILTVKDTGGGVGASLLLNTVGSVTGAAPGGTPVSVTITHGGVGYSAQTRISSIYGAGATFTPIISGGVITAISVSAANVTIPYWNAGALTIFDPAGTGSGAAASVNTVISNNLYKKDDVVTFSDTAGGSGASGTMHVYYEGQAAGPTAINLSSRTVSGKLEILCPPSRTAGTIPTFKSVSSLFIAQTATQLLNVWADDIGSQGDLFGACKAIFNVINTNTSGFLNPVTGLDELGNHFDLYQPFNDVDNFVMEDLIHTVNDNSQGIFADSNAALKNGAIVNCKIYNSNPAFGGSNNFNWGKGGQNVVVINHDSGGGGVPMSKSVTVKDVRLIFTDPTASITPWENTWTHGVSIIYPTTPTEPLDTPPSSTVFDTIAPGKVAEVYDAELTGLMSLSNRGSSGQARLRLGTLWDAKNVPTTGLSMPDSTGAALDIRRPTILMNGFNNRPCLQFTGYNTLTNGQPTDYCLGGGPNASLCGTNTYEIWSVLDNNHSSFIANDTAQRYFWQSGGAGSGNLTLYRQYIGGVEHIGVSNGYTTNGTTPAGLNSVDTSHGGAGSWSGNFSGKCIVRVQVQAANLVMTVWNAANPNGVTVSTPVSGLGPFSYTFRSVLASGSTTTTGASNLNAGHLFDCRVGFNAALASSEVTAMVAEGRNRCGF